MEALDHDTTLRLVRYLGGEADAAEIAALEAILLEDAGARATLLDLAWQAQALHDLAPATVARPRRLPLRTLAAVAACAAILGFLNLLFRPDPAPPVDLAAASLPRVDWPACFEREVSWNDLYSSVLLYPRYVWSHLLGDHPASFSPVADEYPLLAQSAFPSSAQTFDHIHVIPLPETLLPFGPGEFPAL